MDAHQMLPERFELALRHYPAGDEAPLREVVVDFTREGECFRPELRVRDRTADVDMTLRFPQTDADFLGWIFEEIKAKTESGGLGQLFKKIMAVIMLLK